MRSVEASIQHLIGAGFDPHLGRDPYRCFVYTSFQERATKVSHRNTARLAHEHGAASLRRACDAIAVRSAGACAQLTTKGYDHKTPIHTPFDQRFNR